MTIAAARLRADRPRSHPLFTGRPAPRHFGRRRARRPRLRIGGVVGRPRASAGVRRNRVSPLAAPAPDPSASPGGSRPNGPGRVSVRCSPWSARITPPVRRRYDAPVEPGRRTRRPRPAAEPRAVLARRSTPGCSRSPRTPSGRSSSGPSSSPSSRTNLDEFVQVRVSGLQEQVVAGRPHHARPTGRRPAEQLDAIRARIDELVTRQAERVHQARSRRRSPTSASPSRTGPSSTTTTASTSSRCSTRSVFPVLTPTRGRPRAPVPVHLEPLAQPRGRQVLRPDDRRAAVRAREGAAAAARASSCCPTTSGSCRSSR